MPTYRIDFDPTWKIPPVTVDYSDRQKADRTVAEHATPYLKQVLTEKGRPELADCVFQLDEDMAFGQFVHMNLAEGKGARFCPARLLPTDLAPGICGDLNDDEGKRAAADSEVHVVADDSDDPEHVDDCPGCTVA